jgi:hypothetical protein
MKKLIILMLMISATATAQFQTRITAYKAVNGVIFEIGDTFTTSSGLTLKTISNTSVNDIVNLTETTFRIKKIKYYKFRHFRKVIFSIRIDGSRNRYFIDIDEAIKLHDIKTLRYENDN